jgi:hypothetical protein
MERSRESFAGETKEKLTRSAGLADLCCCNYKIIYLFCNKIIDKTMQKVDEIKSILGKHKEHLRQKYKVKDLGIFGSFTRNEETAESDIDILVDFEGDIGLEFIDLADELEKILGHKVDLVSKAGVKPKYLSYVLEDLIYV